MSGTVFNNVHPGLPGFQEGYQWTAGTTPNGAAIFTVPCNGIVDCILGRAEIIETGAATITVVRAAAGTSIANGTALSSITMNVGTGATALAVQVLSQSGPVSGVLALRAGDTVGVQSTGSFSASAGGVTVFWHPA